MLYRPQIVYPYNETVDATDSSVAFTVLIDGTQCVKYTINIYKNIAGTWTLSYTDTQSLSTAIKDRETLTFDVDFSSGSLGFGEYYWNILLYYNSGSYITSHNFPFKASTPPVISFMPVLPAIITTQSYKFIGFYFQGEDVRIKWFKMDLLNSDGDIIDTSGIVESSNIQYTFTALLSGQRYGVQITGVTQENIPFNSGITYFDVSYYTETSLTQPSATMGNDSAVLINYGNIINITGIASGVSAYIPNFLTSGNYGLQLNVGASVLYSVEVPSVFSAHWLWKPASSAFTGTIIGLSNDSGKFIDFGYDGDRFYLNIDGIYTYSDYETLTTDGYFLGMYSDGYTVYIYFRRIT